MESQNETLRAMRRLYTPLTSPRQVISFVPLVEHATQEFLLKMSATTDGSNVMELLRWYVSPYFGRSFDLAELLFPRLTGGTILKIVFGYTIKEKDDPFVRNADIAMQNFSKATTPGWLVDVIPFCAWIWFSFLRILTIPCRCLRPSTFQCSISRLVHLARRFFAKPLRGRGKRKSCMTDHSTCFGGRWRVTVARESGGVFSTFITFDFAGYG